MLPWLALNVLGSLEWPWNSDFFLSKILVKVLVITPNVRGAVESNL